MPKKFHSIAFLILFVLGIAQAQTVYTYPALQTNNTFTNTNTFTGPTVFQGSVTGVPIKPQTYVVSGLPSSALNVGLLAYVSDGTTTSDCTVGGGTNRVLCASGGITGWTAIGSGSGSGVVNPAGQYALGYYPSSGTTAQIGGNPVATIDNTGKVSVGDLAMAPKSTLSVVAEGESTMSGSTLPTSLHAGGSGTAPFNVGPIGNMDLLSAILRKPQWVNRWGYAFNAAVGGKNCAQMVANYTSENVASFAPGGSNAPGATDALDFILLGKNDQQQYTPVSSFQACLVGHLQVITAAGFTPVLITSYQSAELSPVQQALLTGYNQVEMSLKGTVINGKTVHVLNAASAFPPTNAGPDFITPVNIVGALWGITNYQITQSGTAPNQTSTITLTIANTPDSSIMSAYPRVEIGGFNTTQSQFLNLQQATYVSGAGTTTVVYTLDNPLQTTGSVTDAGFIWVTSQGYGPTATVNPGLHMGPDGYERLAQFVNDNWGISGLGTNPNQNLGSSIFATQDGTVQFPNSSFCVQANYFYSIFDFCHTSIAPGQAYFSQQAASGSPSYPGWQTGLGVLYFGDTYHYLRSAFANTTLQTPIYLGDPTALGLITIYNNTGSNQYAVGDTFQVNGTGTGGQGTILGVTNNGVCNYTTGVVGVPCAIGVYNLLGGTSYTNQTNVSTTTLTGTGSGLAVNTFPATSDPLQINTAGLNVAGGTVTACAANVPCPAQQTNGYLRSLSGGPISSTGNSIGASGSGYAVPGPTLVTVTQGSASGGTFNATGANGVLGTFDLHTCTSGGGPLAFCGSNYQVGTWPTTGTGTCTGATIKISSVYAGGAFVLGSLSVVQPASGCVPGDQLTIVEAGASGGIVDVLTTTNGGIIGITQVSSGKKYNSTAPYLVGDPTTGGTGTGLKIKVNVSFLNSGRLVLGTGTLDDDSTSETWTPSGPVTVTTKFTANHLQDSSVSSAGCAQYDSSGNQSSTGIPCGTLSGVVPPANGGTGTTGITGIRQANGSSADTVATPFQLEDSLGLGQNTSQGCAYVFGDSIGAGTAQSNSSAGYYNTTLPGLFFEATLSDCQVNASFNGLQTDQVMHNEALYYQRPQANGVASKVFLESGVNNAIVFNNGGTPLTSIQRQYTQQKLAEALWVLLPTASIFPASTFTQTTGTWFPSGPFGWNSSLSGNELGIAQNGAVLTWTFTTTVANQKVGFMWGANSGTAGTFTAALDSVAQTALCSGTTSYSSSGCGFSNGNGFNAQEFTVATAGSHTLVITTTSAGQVDILLGFVEPATALTSSTTTAAVVFESGVPPGASAESSANTSAKAVFDGLASAVVTTLSAEFPIYFVNLRTQVGPSKFPQVINQSTDYSPPTGACPVNSGLLNDHPDCLGIVKWFNAIYASAPAGLLYPGLGSVLPSAYPILGNSAANWGFHFNNQFYLDNLFNQAGFANFSQFSRMNGTQGNGQFGSTSVWTWGGISFGDNGSSKNQFISPYANWTAKFGSNQPLMLGSHDGFARADCPVSATNPSGCTTLLDYLDSSGNYSIAGSFHVGTSRKGTFVCTAGGIITISNTNELVTSDVIISLNTVGGTISTSPVMKTVTSGTGFTVACGAADTSTYNYTILN